MNKKQRNIVTTLISQIATTAVGVVLPRVWISTFGSAMYGLSASIAQFLSYISLLEGGIGCVARAELYVPLAQKNEFEISRVYHAIKHFFGLIGGAFLIYTLVLSVAYNDIAHVQENRLYIFSLVWVISIGTLAKYLVGLTNLTLINADQKQYVGNVIVTTATVVNALLVIMLSKAGCDFLVVKIGSSIVYVMQPIFFALYVKSRYRLPYVGKNRSELKQKWTGMGQHIAYFLHRNTDVVILTLLVDLQWVAVYSIYRLIISSIRNIAAAFSSGMEAALGELIAEKKQQLLQSVFFKYKHLLSFMSVILFGTMAVLIVPFIRLYTEGVSDADYIQPVFAMVLLFAEAIDCFMHPCCSLPISANKLKETRWGSYGEATINIVLSLILVHWNPLVGIALATLGATGFKSLFYMIYAAKNILRMRLGALLKNFLLTMGMIGLFAVVGVFFMANVRMENYFVWFLWGCGSFGVISLMTTVVYFLFYPVESKAVLTSIWRKFKRW